MRKLIIQLRSFLLTLLTHNIGLPLLKVFRKTKSFPYTNQELASLSEGSLGHDLYVFLSERNYPLNRQYARHDLKHVLLEYDTTDEGEVCLQSFMLGNGRISFPVIATVFYGLLVMPEYWRKMLSAFKKGKRCKPFYNWSWFELLSCNTGELRNKIIV